MPLLYIPCYSIFYIDVAILDYCTHACVQQSHMGLADGIRIINKLHKYKIHIIQINVFEVLSLEGGGGSLKYAI